MVVVVMVEDSQWGNRRNSGFGRGGDFAVGVMKERVTEGENIGNEISGITAQREGLMAKEKRDGGIEKFSFLLFITIKQEDRKVLAFFPLILFSVLPKITKKPSHFLLFLVSFHFFLKPSKARILLIQL